MKLPGGLKIPLIISNRAQTSETSGQAQGISRRGEHFLCVTPGLVGILEISQVPKRPALHGERLGPQQKLPATLRLPNRLQSSLEFAFVVGQRLCRTGVSQAGTG